MTLTLCGNHRVNLVEGASYAYICPKFSGDLYCTTLFICSSGMFLRICLAAKVLARRAVMGREQKRDEELTYEWAQFLLDARVFHLESDRLMPGGGLLPRARAAGADGDGCTSIDLREWRRQLRHGASLQSVVDNDPCKDMVVKKYAQLLMSFILVFNCHLGLTSWTHECESPECCMRNGIPFVVEVMREKMSAVASALVLSSLPTTPEKGKWTKSYPCIVWFARCVGPHNMLRDIVELAADGLPEQIVRAKGGEDDDAVQCGMDVDFAAIKGYRRQRASAFVSNQDTRFHIFLFCIVVEPLRFLCSFFLRSVSGSHGGGVEHPPAMDLASPISSPVLAMLRYFGALLRCSSKRTRLLWAFDSDTFEQWGVDFLHRVAQCRRAILGVACWLEMRFIFYKSWPYKLIQTADKRLPSDVRDSVARRFATACSLCLDKGCGRRLQSKLQVWEKSRDMQWQRAISAWAHQIPVAIGDVEHTHASDNVIAGERPTAAGFVCRTFLKDGHLLSKAFASWAARREQPRPARLPAPRAKHDNLLASVSTCLRSLSPFDIFKKACSLSGEHVGKLGAESTRTIVAKFEALPQTVKDEYASLSSETAAIAKRNRAMRRSLQSLDSPSAALGDQPAAPCSELAPVPWASRAWHHQAVGDVWLRVRRGVDVDSDAVVPVQPEPSSVGSDPAQVLPGDVHSPVSHSVLSAVTKRFREEKKTIALIHSDAQRRFSQFCRAEPALLGPIDYPTMCGAMCRDPLHTAASYTKLRDDFTRCLRRLVDIIGGPKQLLHEELFVMVRSSAQGSGGPPGTRLFTVAAALCQAGPNHAVQMFVESSLLGEPVALHVTLPDNDVLAAVRGREAQVRKAARSLQVDPQSSSALPAVFRDAQRDPPMSMFTTDELIAEILGQKVQSVVVQRVVVEPSARGFEFVRISGLAEERFTVALNQNPVAIPAKLAPPKSGIDLLDDVSTARPSEAATGATSRIRHGNRDNFKAMGEMLQEMFGLRPDDLLLTELAKVDEVLVSAAADVDAGAAWAAGEGDVAGEEEAGIPLVVETMDDVLRRLSVTLAGKSYFLQLPGGSHDPPARKLLGVINTIRRLGVEKSLQAVCQQGHGQCKLHIDLHYCGSRLALETKMLEWLVAGSRCSEQAHFQQSVDIRRSLGVRVK